MLVDSGFEHECTIDQQTAQNLNWRAAANLQSNFGPLIGYIMQIEISVIQFKKHIPCYTNANLEIALAQEKFEGLIGLKLLKEFMYGGDSIEFFLEY